MWYVFFDLPSAIYSKKGSDDDYDEDDEHDEHDVIAPNKIPLKSDRYSLVVSWQPFRCFVLLAMLQSTYDFVYLQTSVANESHNYFFGMYKQL